MTSRKFIIAVLAIAFMAAQGVASPQPPEAESSGDATPFLRVEARGHTAVCKWIGFTADGMRLLSAGDDKVIRVWNVLDLQKPTLERSIRGEIGFGADGMIYDCAIAPRLTANGRSLVACGGFFGPPHDDGGDDYATGQIRLFDIDTGELVGILDGHELNSTVTTLDFSSEGRYLVSGGEDTAVYVWDLAPLMGPVDAPAQWQPDPNWLAEVEDLLQVLELHKEPLQHVSFQNIDEAAAEQSIVSVSHEMMVVWNHDEEKWLDVSQDTDGLFAGWQASVVGGWNAFTAVDETESGFIVMKGKETLFAAKSEEIDAAPQIGFSPDGRFILAGGFPSFNDCQVYSIPSGKLVSHFKRHDNTILGVAWSPQRSDGKRVVASTGGDCNDIWLWDPVTGLTLGHMKSSGRPVYAVAFSQDGTQLAFGQEKTFSQVDSAGDIPFAPLTHAFDLSEMAQVGPVVSAEDSSRWVRSLVEHNGLTVESRRGGERIVIFDDGQRVSAIDSFQEDELINCWTFLPDDTARLIVGTDFGLLGFDALTGEHLVTFEGHEGAVWDLAVSADGRFLASAGGDQTIRIWNAETLEMMLTFFPNSDGEWVLWNEAGYYMSSPLGDELFGWHVNQGHNQAAVFYKAAQFRALYERPELIRLIYKLGGVTEAETQVNQMQQKIHRDQSTSPTKVGQVTHESTARSLMKIAPPRIEILEPKDRSVAATEETSLKLFIDTEQMAKNNQQSVHLYVKQNGRPLLEKVRHTVGLDALIALKGVFELPVKLVPGSQTLTVIAETDAGTRSEPVSALITSPAKGDQDLTAPQLVILAIGVSEYVDNTWRDLDFADDDALALESAFRRLGGNIFSGVHAKVLTDQEANRVGVLDGLKWVRERSKEIRDNVVVCVCIAGHGTEEEGQYFFVPHDFDTKHSAAGTGIRWADFLLELQAIQAPVFLLMDTCHSGGVTGEGSRPEVSYSLKQTIATAYDPRYGLNVFTSSLATQESLEDASWEGHGAFTLAMLEALSGQQRKVQALSSDSSSRGRLKVASSEAAREIAAPGPADASGDGYVDVEEFQAYVVQRVMQLTGGRQQPKAYFRTENSKTKIAPSVAAPRATTESR